MGFLSDKDQMPGVEEINDSALASLRPRNVMQPQPAPGRRKVSPLDLIGGVADALAEFGEAAPGYREGVARREAREAQRINQDFQQRFNQQKLASGQDDMEAARFERFGTAARGLGAVFQRSGIPGVQKAFPIIARQLGMDEEEQQIFGAALQEDPEGTLSMLNEINAPKQNQGSQPKELAIYNMLKERDPAAAEDYLNRVATGVEGMSDYQREQLRLGRDKLTSAERIARIRATRAGQGGTGAGGKSGTPRIDPGTLDLALGVTGELRDIYKRLDQSGASVNPDRPMIPNVIARARSSGIGQLIEGAVGTEAQTERDRIASIRPNLIRRISEATGMTASQMNSDKDMQLLLDQVTDPTRSTQANLDAIRRLEELIVSRAQEVRRPSAARPRPRIKLRPKTSPAPGTRMKYNPATGRIE